MGPAVAIIAALSGYAVAATLLLRKAAHSIKDGHDLIDEIIRQRDEARAQCRAIRREFGCERTWMFSWEDEG